MVCHCTGAKMTALCWGPNTVSLKCGWIRLGAQFIIESEIPIDKRLGEFVKNLYANNITHN